ncbi:MAG: tRNA pseudouridine(38-40) synthase TruA [Verrucomicrobia bacterium]|nr:tRNA pseudouridine(38-40) synthase TruA [Verrucomicrobiota bacterium]MBU4430129.1 tRNA pseudouridine(38-40) synthase TruA [Verrucomicrobiota bacterium]MCG2680342.1 tRNA pseudouridine(38-40) synthase TruA [Kiritimatiellia bacterium]
MPTAHQQSLPRYKLTLAYDGAAYAGWQVQPGHRTIQGELENALATLAGSTVKVHGSGRTDQGVHAAGQVAHADLPRAWLPRDLRRTLNALLPPDIRLLNASRVKGDFHARRSAVSKEYRYLIWNDEVMPPCLRLYRTHIRVPLAVPVMRAAAAALVGHHDFASFTANPNRPVESTVRHLTRLSIRRHGKEITIIARSEGFLYKMVRSLVGLLIRVGSGAVPPAEAKAILRSRERTARVPTAPPEGLFLWRVQYTRRSLSPAS